jgi:hypothetical protein
MRFWKLKSSFQTLAFNVDAVCLILCEGAEMKGDLIFMTLCRQLVEWRRGKYINLQLTR